MADCEHIFFCLCFFSGGLNSFKVQSFQTCDARSVGKNSNKEKIDRGKKLFHFLTGFGISSFDKFPRAAVFRPASEGDSDLTSSGVSFW